LGNEKDDRLLRISLVLFALGDGFDFAVLGVSDGSLGRFAGWQVAES
jgi:hypothetical protein